MPAVLPELFTASCIKKRPEPILQSSDLPYPSALVFNAGVIKYNGEYVMIFRNDYGTDKYAYENEHRGFKRAIKTATNIRLKILPNFFMV